MEQKETVCSVAKKCGGCRYQGVPYQDQLRKKQKITEGLLKKFGKVEPIIGMEDPYYYRNKVHAAFGRDRKGNVISGIYEEKSHRIVSAGALWSLLYHSATERSKSFFVDIYKYIMINLLPFFLIENLVAHSRI